MRGIAGPFVGGYPSGVTEPPRAKEPYRGRQPQGEHKCTVCGDVFETEDDLRAHQTRRHGAEPSPG